MKTPFTSAIALMAGLWLCILGQEAHSQNFITSRTRAESGKLVFPTPDTECIPYRIPALAQTSSGDLVAVADYRYCRSDIGYGEIDLRASISHDNGKTWGEIFTIVHGQDYDEGNLNTGYGDPCLASDKESDRLLLISCSGNVGFFQASREHHQGMARFYSEDGGKTWSKPVDISESIYRMFDKSKSGAPKSIFVGSGRIFQSRYIKVKDYYRIYCALAFRDVNDVLKNYVIYSDDFGGKWSVLGGADVAPIPVNADEPKVEELPDGSVLISSRTTGGRHFNIFTYSNPRKAKGHWGKSCFSGAHNNGVAVESNATNGEILILPAIRISDGQSCHIALQSLPQNKNRSHVGISFKELLPEGDYDCPENFAKDWDGCYLVTETGSCYSTMILQNDRSIGFLYEEDANGVVSGGGFDIVYINFSLEEITGGRYRLN